MNIRDENNFILKKFCYNFKGLPENCVPSTNAQWQPTGVYQCALNGGGQNTGYQQRQEKDINPASVTYNQTRWVANGYNTTACPIPSTCTTSTCTGEAYKCVNGQCEYGYRVNMNSVYNSTIGMYECTYHYEWSDGTWSQNYIENTTYPCALN